MGIKFQFCNLYCEALSITHYYSFELCRNQWESAQILSLVKARVKYSMLSSCQSSDGRRCFLLGEGEYLGQGSALRSLSCFSQFVAPSSEIWGLPSSKIFAAFPRSSVEFLVAPCWHYYQQCCIPSAADKINLCIVPNWDEKFARQYANACSDKVRICQYTNLPGIKVYNKPKNRSVI